MGAFFYYFYLSTLTHINEIRMKHNCIRARGRVFTCFLCYSIRAAVSYVLFSKSEQTDIAHAMRTPKSNKINTTQSIDLYNFLPIYVYLDSWRHEIVAYYTTNTTKFKRLVSTFEMDEPLNGKWQSIWKGLEKFSLRNAHQGLRRANE